MLYFISDVHSGEKVSGLNEYLSIAKEDDLLIILGDVGLKFTSSEENIAFDKFFLEIDKKIAIIDGNHENHAYLSSFPEEDWCGGRINRLSKNIVRLKRGNVFNIFNKTFFVMGGCKSSAKWKDMGLWFDGEEPTKEELSLAYKNLRKHNNKVDYILTHKYRPDMRSDDKMTLDGLYSYIDDNVSFASWYAGHWHKIKSYDDKHFIIYDKLTPLK